MAGAFADHAERATHLRCSVGAIVQTKTVALFFGRKSVIEDAVDILGRNPKSVVSDFDHQVGAISCGADE